MQKVVATCNDGGRWQTIPVVLEHLIKHKKTCNGLSSLMDEHNHVIKKIIGRNKNFLTMRYKLI
jgi:hypothetical protein